MACRWTAALMGGGVVVEIPEGVEELKEMAFKDQTHIKEIIIPDTVKRIGSSAFSGCIALEKLIIPDSVPTEGFNPTGLAADCKNLKVLRAPHAKFVNYSMFFGCENLETVSLDTTTEIEHNTFSDCKNLKEVHIDGKSLYSLDSTAFDGCPEEVSFVIGGVKVPVKHLEFTRKLSDGLGLSQDFQILLKAREILQDETYSPILVSRLCNAQHYSKLDKVAEKIKKDFATIGFYDISDKVDMEAKGKLVELFKANKATRGVVPRIIDALTIASTSLDIAPEEIVKRFEDKSFRDAVIAMRSCHDGNHFFDCEAALFAMTFDINTVKKAILNNQYKDYASVLLCRGYKDKDESAIDAARWIVKHPNSKLDIIRDIAAYSGTLKIAPDMSVEKVEALLSTCKGNAEIEKIEDRYSAFCFTDCVCNLPKTEVELGRYKAYVMDAQDPRQVMLGYDTDCCQHFDGAGESAMMYGLANPNAGFFVIEDKETGKILAQAEAWECKDSRVSLGDEKNALEAARYFSDYLEGYTDDAGLALEELEFDSWEDGEGHTLYGYECDQDVVAVVSDSLGVEVRDPEEIICQIAQSDSYVREEFEQMLAEYKAKINGKRVCLGDKGLCHTDDTDSNKMLVFDNIEYANDRNISQFAPILAKWCKEAPYSKILMGDGYNKMQNQEIRHTIGIEPPLTGDILKAVDTNSELYNAMSCNKDMMQELGYYTPEERFDALARGDQRVIDIIGFGEDYKPYTDAGRSCSVIKDNCKLEPYFNEALKESKKEEVQAVPQQKKHSAVRGR